MFTNAYPAEEILSRTRAVATSHSSDPASLHSSASSPSGDPAISSALRATAAIPLGGLGTRSMKAANALCVGVRLSGSAEGVRDDLRRRNGDTGDIGIEVSGLLVEDSGEGVKHDVPAVCLVQFPRPVRGGVVAERFCTPRSHEGTVVRARWPPMTSVDNPDTRDATCRPHTTLQRHTAAACKRDVRCGPGPPKFSRRASPTPLPPERSRR